MPAQIVFVGVPVAPYGLTKPDDFLEELLPGERIEVFVHGVPPFRNMRPAVLPVNGESGQKHQSQANGGGQRLHEQNLAAGGEAAIDAGNQYAA
jgi:hypothetical protein